MADENLAIQYEVVRPSYELAARHVKDIISTQTTKFKIQDIQHRAKSVESFVKKAIKQNDDGDIKYSDPFKQITDLAGVRLICFLRQDVDPICEKILQILNSDAIEDVGERVFQKGRFGYQSKHILVKLPRTTYLPSCDYIDEVVCEIQVRTLLQHAWAEMEHDIQYKGEKVPDSLRKRFAALAGLLEIADGEFERIQEDSDSLRSAVEEDLLSRLTVEGFKEERSDTNERNPSESSWSVRDLIAAGELQEALNLFNEKIGMEPSAYTLFIGRAKVKFLMGDSSGAINDLDIAENLKTDDPAISNMRRLIEEGNVEHVRRSSSVNIIDSNLVDQANELITLGKGQEAFELFVTLEEQGYSKPFAFINMALCCLLETDSNGAKEYLSKLKINIGTPMSVNIMILKYVISAMDDKEKVEALNELNIILSAVPHFNIDISPVNNFFIGLKNRNRPIYNAVMKDLSKIPQIPMKGRR